MLRRVVITGLGVVNAMATNLAEFRTGIETYRQWQTTLSGSQDPEQPDKAHSQYLGSFAQYLEDYPKQQKLFGEFARQQPLLTSLSESYRVGWPFCSASLLEVGRKAFGSWFRWCKRLDLWVVLSVIASAEALLDAGLSQGDGVELKFRSELCDSFRAGILLGNAGLHFSVHERNQKIRLESDISHMEPLYILSGISNSAAGIVSQIFGMCGPTLNLCSGEATSLTSLHSGKLLIENDHADVCLVGAGEACLSSSLLLAQAQGSGPEFPDTDDLLGAWGLGSHRIFGEGAAILCLEEREHALRRGAHIYAEVLASTVHQQQVATQLSGDSEQGLWQALAAPQQAALEHSLNSCLEQAEQVSSQNVPAQGNLGRDAKPRTWHYRSHSAITEIAKDVENQTNETTASEILGLRSVQQMRAGRDQIGRLGSIKPLIGDCLGAAGGMELISALTNAAGSSESILCYNFGLGGHHATVALRSAE